LRADRHADDLAHHRRVLVEVLAQLLVDELDHVPLNVGVELALGLAFELGLRQLHAHHRCKALADVVAGQVLLDVLEQAAVLTRGIDGAGERAAEAAQVRATVHGVDVVGKAKHVFAIRVVVLQRHFHGQHAAIGEFAFTLERNGLVVQHGLAAIQMLDELGDAADKLKLGNTRGFFALIGERDLQTLVEKRELAQPLRERIEIELAGVHDGRIGLEGDLGSGLAARGLSGFGQRGLGNALVVFLLPGKAIAPDLELQHLRQGVDHANAHAVQPARYLVGIRVELSAGVQLGHHDLGGRHAFLGVHVDWNAAAVVRHTDRIVLADGDGDFGTVSGQRLVHGVVDHFINQVV